MKNYWSAVNTVLICYENGSLDRELTIAAVEDLRKLGLLSELICSRISADDSQTLVFDLIRQDSFMVIEYCLDTIQIEENGGSPVIVPRNEFTSVVERFYNFGDYGTLLEMAKVYGADIGVVVDGTLHTLFFDHLSGKFMDTYTGEHVDFIFANEVIWTDYIEFDDEYMLNRFEKLKLGIVSGSLKIVNRYHNGHARGKVIVINGRAVGYVWHLGTGKLLYCDSGPMQAYWDIVEHIHRLAGAFNTVLSSGNQVQTWCDRSYVGFVDLDATLRDIDPKVFDNHLGHLLK